MGLLAKKLRELGMIKETKPPEGVNENLWEKIREEFVHTVRLDRNNIQDDFGDGFEIRFLSPYATDNESDEEYTVRRSEKHT